MWWALKYFHITFNWKGFVKKCTRFDLDELRVIYCTVFMESDYLKNGNTTHMTNKIPLGSESRYRLEWAHCNLALILAVLNVNLSSVAVWIHLLSCDRCVCSVHHSVCVKAVHYVQVPCWRPSRWQSGEFSACLVVPDTNPAHLGSLWPAAGEAPLYQINTARHHGMDSTLRAH